MIEKLKKRWNVANTKQVLIILLVFALTGSTIVLIKKPLFKYYYPEGNIPLALTILYYIFILPIYNLFLLIYGALLGQFTFFWEFEKKTFSRIFKKKTN